MDVNAHKTLIDYVEELLWTMNRYRFQLAIGAEVLLNL